ncbi:hypothetical protein BCR44DRAFT_1483636 [Catenaria anguillulae PL171]|uniref:Uncharacterized protein n=1 Tax=Catenaria anguillulae PL171 TaxID=765915 RepID=A0A1Y2HTN4_9FUNG|nr:hypothetical protein BCR44DRAFT_1483636 [Catenaria anguillulae PL171]
MRKEYECTYMALDSMQSSEIPPITCPAPGMSRQFTFPFGDHSIMSHVSTVCPRGNVALGPGRKRIPANWAAVFLLVLSSLFLRSPLLHASAHAAPPRPRNSTGSASPNNGSVAGDQAAINAPPVLLSGNANGLSASSKSSSAITKPTWWNPPPAVAAAAGHERRAAAPSPSPAPVPQANSTTATETAARSAISPASSPVSLPPPSPPPPPVPHKVTRPVPQFYSDPACLRPIVNWDFYMSQVSHLFRNVVQRTRRKDALGGANADDERPVVFEDLFTPTATGHVNVLGNIQGIEATKRYFQTLPTLLLASLNMSIVGLSQTHATAACDVASMIHHVSLRDFGDASSLPPASPHPGASESSEAPPNIQPSPPTSPTRPRTSNNMRRLVRRVLQRAADAVDPSVSGQQNSPTPNNNNNNRERTETDAQYPQTPSASSPSSHSHPSWLPHVLAIWSWWRFDTQSGKIVAFEITAFPRDGDHWAPPRGDMVDRVCSEFEAGARCNREENRQGEWADKQACIRGMRQMDEVNTARVTCRYLHLSLLSPTPGDAVAANTSLLDQVAACRELGPLSSVCVPPNAYWFQPPSPAVRSGGRVPNESASRDRRAPDPAAAGGGGDKHHGKAMILDQGVQRKQGVAVQDSRHTVQEGRIEYYEWPGHVHVEL